MGRKSAADAMRDAAEALESDGQVVEGQLSSPAEVDAERIERENHDDIVHALTVLEGAGDAVWKVERVLPVEQAGWCMDIPTALLSQSYIKKKCGPGKYKVRGWNRGNYVGGRTFTIAGTSDDVIPGTAVVAPNLDEFLAKLEGQRGQWKEDLKFWAGLLASAAPLLVPMLTAFFARRHERETPMSELVAAMQGLKAMSDPVDPTAQLSKLGDVIRTVKELMPDPTGTTWPDLIGKSIDQVGTMVGPLLQSRVKTPSITPQSNPAQITQTVAPQTVVNPMMQLINWFRSAMPMLVKQAQRNSDPELYAAYLADNVPEGSDPNLLRQILDNGKWWETFVHFYPPVSPYQGWFSQVRQHLMDMLQEETETTKTDMQTLQQDAGDIPGGE